MSEASDDMQRLIFEGYGALEIAEYERALRAARQLHEFGNTAAFEIEARARWEMDDRDGAIDILKDGVELAPELFVLWDYLASYLSDEGRYDEALQAYYRSRECAEAPVESVDFNIVIVYQRQGRHERALALLDTITPTEALPAEIIESARAHSLNDTGKHADALTRTAACLNQIKEDDDVDPEAIARLMSEHAYALWVLGLQEAAYEEAHEAVGLDKSNERAAWLIREIADERSDIAKGWRVVVEGRWPQPYEDSDKDYGFLATYTVVADSPEEALEYIRSFEPEEVRFTLQINSAVDLEPQPDAPKGVYDAVATYQFFPLHDEE
jgi:tetratricopeptide (TPR) repeat protein